VRCEGNWKELSWMMQESRLLWSLFKVFIY
jgi:hypothetical protein